jgi:hypothetical protein
MTVFFGPRWDAPRVEHAERISTPIGATCHVCGEPIVADDRGLMCSVVEMVDGEMAGTARTVHVECDMLGVLGHQFGACHCTGYDTTRAAGLELLRRLNAAREVDGMGPL